MSTSKESGIFQVAVSLQEKIESIAVEYGGKRAAELALSGDVARLNNLHTKHLITIIEQIVPHLSGEELALAEGARTKLIEHQPSAQRAYPPGVGGCLPDTVHPQTTVGPHY